MVWGESKMVELLLVETDEWSWIFDNWFRSVGLEPQSVSRFKAVQPLGGYATRIPMAPMVPTSTTTTIPCASVVSTSTTSGISSGGWGDLCFFFWCWDFDGLIFFIIWYWIVSHLILEVSQLIKNLVGCLVGILSWWFRQFGWDSPLFFDPGSRCKATVYEPQGDSAGFWF